MTALNRWVRRLAAWGLLGGAIMAMTPLGCANTLETAPLRNGRENSGTPLPRITDERLRQCAVDYAPEIAGQTYVRVDAKVKVDEEGGIREVTTEGIPASSDLAACTRSVLHDMTVPVDLLQELMKKVEEAEKNETTSQHEAGGNLVGHPIVIVIAGVTIVFSEVVLQVGGITVLFMVTMALDEAVEALRRKPRWEKQCEEHLSDCLMTPTADKRGNHWNQGRCALCFAQCKNNRKWPATVYYIDSEESCAY